MRRHADALFAAALALGAAAEVTLADPDAAALQAVVVAAACATLPLRHRVVWVPYGVLMVGFVTLATRSAEPMVSLIVPLLMVLYTAGSTLRPRPSGTAVAAMAVAVFIQSVAEEDVGDALYVTMVFVIPPWLGGLLMRTRRGQVDRLEALHAELAAERERAEALAAEAERGRVAREMHDVLSHGMSLMVLQAGAGPRLLGQDTRAAQQAFANIRATGVRARQELEAALAQRAAPQSLEALVNSVPGASLHVEGDLAELPAGHRLALQRIVQEALTNALKHGGGRGVQVSLRADASGADAVVRDAGGTAAPVPAGAGRGLVGMRERAALYGGTVEAGPLDGGGFEVRARIPA